MGLTISTFWSPVLFLQPSVCEVLPQLIKLKSFLGFWIQDLAKQFLCATCHSLEVAWYLSVPLAPPAAKLSEVRVGQVGFLPRQDSLKTIEDNDSKLEDILHTVNLIIFICMASHKFCGAVRKQLILFYHNVSSAADRAKVAKFDKRKIRSKYEYVVQLHIKVAESLQMDPFQCRTNLLGNPLSVLFPQSRLGDVARQVAQRSVLSGKHEVAVGLEDCVIHS